VATVPDSPSGLVVDLKYRRCLFSTYGGAITALSLETWQPVSHLSGTDTAPPDASSGFIPNPHPRGVIDMARLGDLMVSVSGSSQTRPGQGEAIVWSLAGREVRQVGPTLHGHESGYGTVSLSPGGRYVALGTPSGLLEVYDMDYWLGEGR
jgi:hypothetical protein